MILLQDPRNDTVRDQHCVPDYFTQILICTLVENFKNCPNIETSSECNRVKEALDGCGKEGQISSFLTLLLHTKAEK